MNKFYTRRISFERMPLDKLNTISILFLILPRISDKSRSKEFLIYPNSWYKYFLDAIKIRFPDQYKFE